MKVQSSCFSKLQAFTFEGFNLTKIPECLALVKLLAPTYEGVPFCKIKSF